jgi:hypothetical protein
VLGLVYVEKNSDKKNAYARYNECQFWFLQMPVDAGLCWNRHLQGLVQACPEVCQVQFIQKKLYVIIKRMIYITYARYIECQVWFLQMLVDAGLGRFWRLQGMV